MARPTLPARGRDSDRILADLESFTTDDVDVAGGRTWSLVYYAGPEHHALMEEAHGRFLDTNGLNPMAFKSLKRLETEIVQMTAGLLNGPDSTVGCLTAGGSESLLLAVCTYRDRARKRWPWIRRPNAVVPETVHPAFDKAAHLFGVRLKKVAVGPLGAVDPRAMARRIDRNTIFLAASAPQYVTGVVDPIPELAALARRKRLPLHVDACFGGFVLPFLEELGVPMPAWDFRCDGVTSVSADLHKYGYAPKGISVLLYRDMDWMKHQFFVYTGWPGGIYASPGLLGSRPGGPVAGGWAAMQRLGREGYRELTSKAWQAAEELRAAIAGIDGVEVLGQPHSTVVTWACTEVDTYAVADRMVAAGWNVDRQQNPASIHCSCNATNLPVIDRYAADLASAVDHVRAHPELSQSGDAAMYGMLAKLPMERIGEAAVRQVMAGMYAPDGEPEASDPLEGLPEPVVRGLNRVLDGIARLRGR